MFVSQDKRADEKRGACRAVALAEAEFFTEPKTPAWQSNFLFLLLLLLLGTKIDFAWLEEAIAEPERTEPNPDDPVLEHRLAAIRERDYRVLRVVCAIRRLLKMMKSKAMPFDSKRMAYGGFKVIVNE
jgi:hypothetical protein